MNPVQELTKEGIISEEQERSILNFEHTKPISIHWELRVILYLGVTLLSTGLGILIYNNINTIGHISIIGLISIACLGCFYYAFRFRIPYSHFTVKYPSPFFDYVVLLGCLLFGILIGYVQWQYDAFGYHYGLATLVPTALYLFCAFAFDHKGVLSLGITGIAAWAGIAVSIRDLVQGNFPEGDDLIQIGLVVGLVLLIAAWFLELKDIKKHFGFTINNFAANIIFGCTLGALFEEPYPFLSFILLGLMCFYYIRYARENKSFLFLLLAVVYGYIGLTYVIFNSMDQWWNSSDAVVMLLYLYVIGSCAGVVFFFLKYKKILGIKK